MHQALQDHTPASLLDAIRQGEGASIEFKSSFQKEVIETVQAWINQCKQITSPRVIPDIELVQIEGKTVALVSIGEYPIKPVACKGRYFKRVGNANHQLTATEISDANIKLIAPII